MARILLLIICFFSCGSVFAAGASCSVRTGCPGFKGSYLNANYQLSVEAVCVEHASTRGRVCSEYYSDRSYLFRLANGQAVVGVADPVTIPYTDPSIANDKAACESASVISNSTIGVSYEQVTLTGSHSSGSAVCVPTVGTSSPSVGCTVNFNLDIRYVRPDGTQVSRGTIDTQGGFPTLPCTVKSPDPAKPATATSEKCPPGEQTGQVNGVDVCKPYVRGTTSTTFDGSSTTSTVDGTSTTTTQTKCDAKTCITTQTSTSGTSTVSISNTTQTADAYCQKNPSSLQCGQASGGGESGGCDAGADTMGCAKFGSPGEAEPTANQNVLLTFSREQGFGASNGTCPAARTLSIPGGRSISMSFDLYCQFALGIRPFLIGFALLSAAGMVVFSATRKG